MEMRVLWSDASLSQLQKIYDYHSLFAAPRIAKKMVKGIVHRTLLLESNPLIGVIEPFLVARPFEYRFVVENNYKIIYRVIDNVILIVSVFDCRQNPAKIGNIDTEL
jgi:toxin ParE1/3/4